MSMPTEMILNFEQFRSHFEIGLETDDFEDTASGFIRKMFRPYLKRIGALLSEEDV